MNFLAVNAGSSSLKFALYPAAAGWVDTAIFSGQIEGLAPGGQPQLSWRQQGQAAQQRHLVGSGDPFALALDALVALHVFEPFVGFLEFFANGFQFGGFVLPAGRHGQ